MSFDSKSSPKLRVVIIGAGIAGSAAAAFLRKYPQYEITVHERRGKDFKESSAALGVRINGISILKQLGIRREEIRAVMGAGYRSYNLKEEEMSKSKLGEGPDGDGTLWFVFRQDLKDVLLRRVTSDVGEGDPIRVFYGSHVVEIEPETGMVKFEDGASIIADLIIGKQSNFRGRRGKSCPLIWRKLMNNSPCHYRCRWHPF